MSGKIATADPKTARIVELEELLREAILLDGTMCSFVDSQRLLDDFFDKARKVLKGVVTNVNRTD